MKKKKSKKHNPNLLSWLVDPNIGLFSPIGRVGYEAVKRVTKAFSGVDADLLMNVSDMATDTLEAIAKTGVIGFGPFLGAYAIENLNLKGTTGVPKDPAGAWKAIETSRDGFNVGAGSLLGLTTLAGLIPFGSVGDALDEVWRLPYVESCMAIGKAGYLSEFESGISPLIQRHWQKQYTPLIPEAYRLADMCAKGLMGDKTYVDAMAQNGLPSSWAMRWKYLQQIQPDLETLLTMWRRNFIIKSDVDSAFNRMGYNPMYVPAMLKLKEEVVSPEVIAVAMQKEWLTDEEYNKIMTRYGLNEEEAKWLYWSNEKIPDLATLYNLKWRGLIDDKVFDRVMKGAMYPGWLVKPLKDMATVIPPLPDMITMAVKEAFGKHTYEEQMPALLEWGGKMGLSKDWVERYWYAHWDRIALREMYSNLWRGYWNKDAFMRMLRIKDVHPDDREAIYNVAYLPPSIREMGYGYDMGVYDRADIVRYRKWGGMSPPDAEKAADSLIRYRTSAEIEAVRREWLWKFAHGRISIDSYIQALLDLDTPIEAIGYWLKRGEMQFDRFRKPTPIDEGRIISSTEAKWAFKNGIRDESWLRTALAELDWTSERIDLTIERLKIEIAEKEKPPTPPIRAISLSDLRRAFRYEIINEAAFRQEFENRGYSIEDINIIVTLELYHRPVPPPVKIPEITFSQLAGIFRRGIITEAEFRSELAEREYTAEDIERLVTLEILKGIAPSPEITYRNLTATQIRNLYRFGKLSEAEIPLAFQKIGYTEKDASSLAQILIAGEVTVETPKQLSRTDVARFYDLGIYSITDVYNAYVNMGYTSEDAQGLALYTAVNIEFPDLRAMYSKGWITEEAMYNELLAIGLNADRASELMMTAVKAEQPQRIEAERDLTKSELVKGVKLGILEAPEAAKLLIGLGYDELEAWYVLLVNQALDEPEKMSYWSWRRVVEAWRRARGLSYTEIPEEMILLELAIKEKKLEIAKLKAEEASETVIAEAVNSLGALERSMAILIREKHLA